MNNQEHKSAAPGRTASPAMLRVLATAEACRRKCGVPWAEKAFGSARQACERRGWIETAMVERLETWNTGFGFQKVTRAHSFPVSIMTPRGAEVLAEARRLGW